MTTQKTNLLATTADPAKLRILATSSKTAKFASVAANIDLLPGTVVAYNTSTNLWVQWVNDGTNSTNLIAGIVWPDKITLLTSGEVLGVVMLRGRAHVDDLLFNALLGTVTNTLALMKTALSSGVREKGIDIIDLPTFH